MRFYVHCKSNPQERLYVSFERSPVTRQDIPANFLLKCAGTGTTLVVSNQLKRMSIGIEIDPTNIFFINERLSQKRNSDNILKYRNNYLFTKNLNNIWLLQEKNNDSKQYEMLYENIL